MDLNPQAKQMADESMVRNLAAQAQAIWPQEVALFGRYALVPGARVLDAGCGTGEISSRLARLYPQARVLGVDIIDEHLELARRRHAELAPRLSFDHQSVYELQSDNGAFDLTVCRHVLHSIPDAPRVLTELARVTKPAGYIHLIPEDYGMLHFQRGKLDPSDFWSVAPAQFESATNTDLHIGRNIYGMLLRLGLEKVGIDYIPVDTLRCREAFAHIIQAWRDGYVESIAELTTFSAEQTKAYFDQMLANINHTQGYAVWMVPVVTARVPRK